MTEAESKKPRVNGEGSEVPIGNSPPSSRWPLAVAGLAWLAWLAFLAVMAASSRSGAPLS